MKDKQVQKLSRCFDGRRKYEEEFYRPYSDLKDSLLAKARTVKFERSIQQCQITIENAIRKNDDLRILAQKTLEPSSALADLDTWLISITCARDEMLELSIEHLEMARTLFPETGDADPQASRAASTVSRSTRHSYLHTRASSKTSSQRKRELEIAKLRRLEIERQNETGIRSKEKENELALETLVDENKRKLNEAKIVETELMDDDSDIDTDINKTALPSSRTQQVVAETRTKDWVDEALDTHSSELASTITIVPRQEPQPPGIANLVSSSLTPSTVDLINVHLFPSSSNPSVCLPLQSVVSSTVHSLKIPSQPLPPPPPPPRPVLAPASFHSSYASSNGPHITCFCHN